MAMDPDASVFDHDRFNDWLDDYCRRHGVLATTAAEMLGISRAHLSRIRHRRRSFGLDAYVEATRRAGLPLDAWLKDR